MIAGFLYPSADHMQEDSRPPFFGAVMEFVLRFTPFMPLAASFALALISGLGLPAPWALLFFPVGLILTLVGLYDLRQPLHSVRRNYPIIGRLRWFFEEIRPEIRQYLIEGDHEQTPFSRSQRSLVYARAKNEVSDRAFGTLVDVYKNGYEFIAHSTQPVPVADPATFRIRIGGNDCSQPYMASIFNISAMSFGALSANAIRALNKGAKLGGFAHDTGEGSISPYHREHGGRSAGQDDRTQDQPGRQAG
jgi:glutamate synthase domain-containing protein 2